MDTNHSISTAASAISPTPKSTSATRASGLTPHTVNYISDVKDEPDWVRDFRLKALDVFESKPHADPLGEPRSRGDQFRQHPLLPLAGHRAKRTWDDVPDDVKKTFERLGIPENERKFLAGVEAQFDSEAVYSNIKKAVGDQGVIFVGSTDGLKKHPEIFRKWFGKVIPTGDNKFSALNSAGFQRRQLHLCAAGREGETPAPGLFPHQRRELRPVRAHPHHRR